MSTEAYDALKDDWQATEDVVDAGFSYGPNRFTTGLPTSPSSGVKVRVGNPTQSQILSAAATSGFRSTDKQITVWANTLRETPDDSQSEAITPVENDKLLVEGVVWIVKTVKVTIYGTQFNCYCQQSTSTPE